MKYFFYGIIVHFSLDAMLIILGNKFWPFEFFWFAVLFVVFSTINTALLAKLMLYLHDKDQKLQFMKEVLDNISGQKLL